MKTICPITNDEALHRALKEWRIDALLSPHFYEMVWQCIAVMESTNRNVRV